MISVDMKICTHICSRSNRKDINSGWNVFQKIEKRALEILPDSITSVFLLPSFLRCLCCVVRVRDLPQLAFKWASFRWFCCAVSPLVSRRCAGISSYVSNCWCNRDTFQVSKKQMFMQRQVLLPSREIQNNPATSNVTFCSNTRRVYEVKKIFP